MQSVKRLATATPTTPQAIPNEMHKAILSSAPAAPNFKNGHRLNKMGKRIYQGFSSYSLSLYTIRPRSW